MWVCKYDQYLIVKQKFKESAKEELTFVLFNIDGREKVNKFESFLSFIGYSNIFWINQADVWQFKFKEILLIWGDFSDTRVSANQKINLFQSNISFLLTISFSTISFPKFCSSFIFLFHISHFYCNIKFYNDSHNLNFLSYNINMLQGAQSKLTSYCVLYIIFSTDMKH